MTKYANIPTHLCLWTGDNPRCKTMRQQQEEGEEAGQRTRRRKSEWGEYWRNIGSWNWNCSCFILLLLFHSITKSKKPSSWPVLLQILTLIPPILCCSWSPGLDTLQNASPYMRNWRERVMPWWQRKLQTASPSPWSCQTGVRWLAKLGSPHLTSWLVISSKCLNKGTDPQMSLN